MKRILVVEDDFAISTLLQYNLQKMNYEVAVISDGKTAIDTDITQYDLIILDVMLPKLDGISVIKKIREKGNEIAVLMLTALSSKKDIVKGLNAGADDYVTKPFSIEEIVARIQALLRRKTINRITIKKFSLENNLLTIPSGQQILLTKKEAELFDYLHKNRGQVLSRDQILMNIWPLDVDNSSRVVDIQISHLRDKIEPNPKNPIYLLTIRGFGYKLEEPDES